MTDFLLKTFIKDNDYHNEKVREKGGTLSSFTGIACNILLFIIKFVIGTVSNSIAIVSDAFNNLSDCLSCIITFFGYKLAAQPADKDHPFGHGRIEYLVSLVIAALILVVGVEFFKTSIDKLLNPEPVIFSWITVICVFASIGVKFWMHLFNKKLGNLFQSPSMLATSQDSLSDCITTSVTLISLFASLFTDWPVDGVIGLIVSALILKSGYEIIKDTVDTLLGSPADEKTLKAILDIVLSHEQILGVHDVIVHNYGPGHIMASLHAEIDANQNIMLAHDTIDNIERDLYDELKIMAVIHMDPIDTQNKQLGEYKELVTGILQEIDPELTMHDFRMVPGETHTNLIFDVIITDKYRSKTSDLKKEIDVRLSKKDEKLKCVVTFDTKF